jgi:predicted RNA methylase
MVTSLHNERLEKVIQTLLASHAESVLDLGCGPGKLLARLASEQRFKKIVGIDISLDALAAARHLLANDAAVMLETIEHVDPHRLSAVEQAVFAGYCPRTVLVTTPNRDYNVLHGLPEGARRHRDHRFEWCRSKFRTWSEGVARRHGYWVVFDDIGAVYRTLGGSTQMATFVRL